MVFWAMWAAPLEIAADLRTITPESAAILQNQAVIYRLNEAGEESVFIDPNTLSEDGTTSIAALSFSPSGALAAYQKSEGGADWRSVEVIDTETLEVIDRIEDVKFSGLAWQGERGFYYSRYDSPEGNELTAKTDHHRLYFHALGTEVHQALQALGESRLACCGVAKPYTGTYLECVEIRGPRLRR